jgi:iron complex outermembrane receptor protein
VKTPSSKKHRSTLPYIVACIFAGTLAMHVPAEAAPKKSVAAKSSKRTVKPQKRAVRAKKAAKPTAESYTTELNLRSAQNVGNPAPVAEPEPQPAAPVAQSITAETPQKMEERGTPETAAVKDVPDVPPAPQTKSASNVFTLGQITVIGKSVNDISPLGADKLDSEQLRDFDRAGLSEALNIMPGVAVTPGSGARNEPTLSVRGFSGSRVPLMMDGIRLYLPYDNAIDFNRFLTPDLAEIQVSKGYVSVINGPDGMGGAINLVTRKPVKRFEGEVSGSAYFSNDGRYNGNMLYTHLGTRQDKFYFQASAERRDNRGYYVSDDFKSTQYLGSGDRFPHTSSKDWRLNMKVGFTPNNTDEYSLNFIKQRGEKHALYSGISADPNTTGRTVWDWPVWDVWSLYWLSNTKLGEKSYIKSRAYYSKFENHLISTCSVNCGQLLGNQNWTSYYDDNAYGASVELGTDLIPKNTLKGALYWRRDNHTEQNKYPAFTGAADEPKQDTEEDIVSLAVEDTWHVIPTVDLVVGVSRDARFTHKSEECSSNASQANPGAPCTAFKQNVADAWATNWQIAGIWHYRPTGTVNLGYSNRTRFPTMKERFSSRNPLGTGTGMLSNANLQPERAHNIELSLRDQIVRGLTGSVAVFRNKVDDAIGTFYYLSGPLTGNRESRNVGEAIYKGVELGLTATPFQSLEVGASYTYLDTKVKMPDNFNNNQDSRLSAAPRNKSFFYARWQPLPKLTLIPSFEVADKRSTGAGAYELLNLRIAYQILKNWEVSLTGRNLLDRNYEYSTGFPQEGRNYVLSTRIQF